MSKLYTKTGDKGITSLYDGNRIPKTSIFFEVLGTIDELSCHLGLLIALLKKNQDCKFLRIIQIKLLDIGSNIAVTSHKKVPKILEQDVKNIEVLIDYYDKINSKLTEFVLPGVYQADAQCHICRSVSRRAERLLWKINNKSGELKVTNRRTNIVMDDVTVDVNILQYMNRLSDFLFSYARFLSNCKEIKVSDIKRHLINEKIKQ